MSSLVDFIEKLQNKPKYIRVQIMWLGVTVCMIVFLFLWLWSLDSITGQARQQKEEKTDDFSQNWQQVKEDIPTLWQSLGAGIGNLMDSINLTEGSPSPAANEENYLPTDKLPLE
ncbi:MAG: hypothetical protein PHW33_00660 [Candidatus Portnoybacteria bacterium]|jgi:cytosine/uracil/thiamine/allantoin permease|nr:hypothetical protein [Candidatus Portnoybacteria bacterium]